MKLILSMAIFNQKHEDSDNTIKGYRGRNYTIP